MKVIVLTTGRAGSTTFAKACSYMENFTSGHETRRLKLGEQRLSYPDQHIEVDNRLAWFLGRMDKSFGDEVFYVWLRRNSIDVAKSENKRWNKSLIPSYAFGLLGPNLEIDGNEINDIDVAKDLVYTIEENIRFFLKDKTYQEVWLKSAKKDFKKFWNAIGAEGDLNKALETWDKKHNTNKTFFKYENEFILKLKMMYRKFRWVLKTN